MSAFLGSSALVAAIADLSNVFLSLPRSIGGLVPDLVTEERGEDELEITQHPVEVGADVTDHTWKKNPQVTIECMWSNSSLAALLTGAGFLESYSFQMYGALLALQASGVPMTVSTGKRLYPNMLIRSVSNETTVDTEYCLKARVVCQQILLVTTQSTTLPPQANQANAFQTASPADSTTNVNPSAPDASVQNDIAQQAAQTGSDMASFGNSFISAAKGLAGSAAQ